MGFLQFLKKDLDKSFNKFLDPEENAKIFTIFGFKAKELVRDITHIIKFLIIVMVIYLVYSLFKLFFYSAIS